MFCGQCGANLLEGAKFCNKCGGAVAGAPASSAEAQPAMNAVKKRVSPLKIVLPIVAVAVLAAVGFVVRGIYSREVAPVLAVSRAMSNLGEELSLRLETTPLQAFGQLMDALDYGTVNVNVAYREDWGWHTSVIEADVSIASNSNAGAAALRGDIRVDGIRFDIAAYINRDSFAMGSRAISRDYYGIRFATFREDIRPFGQMLGLSQSDMDAAADIVEEIERALVQGSTFREEYDEYIQALADFFRDAEQESERVDLSVGEDTLQARRVRYIFGHESFVALFSELLEIFENDESIRAAFDNPIFDDMGVGMDMYREIAREMQNALGEMEARLSGEAILSFYIGDRNRLLRVELDADIVFDGEAVGFGASLDFGQSATDTWRFNFNVAYEGEDDSLEMIWEHREAGGRHENTWELTLETGWAETHVLSSSWDPNSGAFSFSHGAFGEELLSGNFTTDGETFRLFFTHSDNWGGQDLTLEMTTERATDIPSVDFINIDQWDQALLDNIVTQLWNLGF